MKAFYITYNLRGLTSLEVIRANTSLDAVRLLLKRFSSRDGLLMKIESIKLQ